MLEVLESVIELSRGDDPQEAFSVPSPVKYLGSFGFGLEGFFTANHVILELDVASFGDFDLGAFKDLKGFLFFLFLLFFRGSVFKRVVTSGPLPGLEVLAVG